MGRQCAQCPAAIYANIYDGELPFIKSNATPFGGHITHTSGTTGSSKKLLLDSTFEDQRNAAPTPHGGFWNHHALSVGRTAIVLFNSTLDGWILLLALRSLGLNTICVRTIEIAEQLKLRDVAFVVVTQFELNSHKLRDQTLSGTQVIVVPTIIYASSGRPPVRPFETVRVTIFNEFPRTKTATRKTRRSVLKKTCFWRDIAFYLEMWLMSPLFNLETWPNVTACQGELSECVVQGKKLD